MSSHGGRVVVGVSGSLCSLTALHRAVDEARRADVELLAVTAWTPPGGEFAYRRSPCPPLLTACETAAAGRLQQAFTDAFGGFPADTRLRLVTACGEAGFALTELADQPDDLLVISTGRQGRPRMFHGAVSRYCLAHARCDVLAVPPSDLMRAAGRTARELDRLALPTAPGGISGVDGIDGIDGINGTPPSGAAGRAWSARLRRTARRPHRGDDR